MSAEFTLRASAGGEVNTTPSAAMTARPEATLGADELEVAGSAAKVKNPHSDYLARFWQDGYEGKQIDAERKGRTLAAWKSGKDARSAAICGMELAGWINNETIRGHCRLGRVWLSIEKTEEDDTPIYVRAKPQAVALAAPAVVVSAEPVADSFAKAEELSEVIEAIAAKYGSRNDFGDAIFQPVNWLGFVADLSTEVARATPVGPDAVDARDAARYRWLRDQANEVRETAPMVFMTAYIGGPPDFRDALVNEALDRAVDAALASTKPSKGAA